MPTTTQAPSGPLAERSPNTLSQSPTKPAAGAAAAAKDKTTMMTTTTTAEFATADVPAQKQQKQQQQRQQTYISPSDNILSPTTKKLGEIKGRRFASGKPQSLFAKTVSRQGMRSQVVGGMGQGQGADVGGELKRREEE